MRRRPAKQVDRAGAGSRDVVVLDDDSSDDACNSNATSTSSALESARSRAALGGGGGGGGDGGADGSDRAMGWCGVSAERGGSVLLGKRRWSAHGGSLAELADARRDRRDIEAEDDRDGTDLGDVNHTRDERDSRESGGSGDSRDSQDSRCSGISRVVPTSPRAPQCKTQTSTLYVEPDQVEYADASVSSTHAASCVDFEDMQGFKDTSGAMRRQWRGIGAVLKLRCIARSDRPIRPKQHACGATLRSLSKRFKTAPSATKTSLNSRSFG